jgi:hypothetical protein
VWKGLVLGSGSGFSYDRSVQLGGSSASSYVNSSEAVSSGSRSVSVRVKGQVRRSVVQERTLEESKCWFWGS